MRITAELLRRHGACKEQCATVATLWPDGAVPTIDALTEAAANGLDPWWLWRLLPAEGPGSRRAYALWCAEQVAHLCSAPRVAQCMAVVRRRVESPGSVTDDELRRARSCAADAASAAAYAYACAAVADRERLLGYLEGTGRTILTEPEALLTSTPRVTGLDGRKMSKSYGNTIGMREDPDEVAKKLKTMQTDPARVRRTDPGHPEKCPVWDLHLLYSDASTQSWAAQGCRSAGIGCLECKKPVIDKIVEEVTGMRQRAQEYEDNPDLVRGIIAEGCEKAREVAGQTLDDVKQAMGLAYR